RSAQLPQFPDQASVLRACLLQLAPVPAGSPAAACGHAVQRELRARSLGPAVRLGDHAGLGRHDRHCAQAEPGRGQGALRGVRAWPRGFPRRRPAGGAAPGHLPARRHVQGPGRGPAWRVTCAGADTKLIGKSAISAMGAATEWTEFVFLFTVPPTDCRAQYVRLALEARSASERLLSGAIWYDDLRITRSVEVGAWP